MRSRGRYWGGKIAHGIELRLRLPRGVFRPKLRTSTVDSAILVVSLVCSAGLMAVAVGTDDFPWVGWVGLVPIFLVIRVLSPGRAMLCGALWGFCLYIFSVSNATTDLVSINNSLVFLTAIPALYAYLGARLTRRVGFQPLFLAFGWVGLECALRPLGLGSGLLAGTQGDAGIIQVVGGPLGYFIVAFLIAFANAKLVSITGDIRFRTGRSRALIYADVAHDWVLPQSSFYFSLITVVSCRPRAPPPRARIPG